MIPPRRDQAVNQATDDMGHLWLQVLPRYRRPSPSDSGGNHAASAGKVSKSFRRTHEFGSTDAFALRCARCRVGATSSCSHRSIPSSCARRAPRGFGEFGATSGRYPSVSVGASGRAEYLNARYNLAVALVKRGGFHEPMEQLRLVVARHFCLFSPILHRLCSIPR
jgi:hypothetical protein